MRKLIVLLFLTGCVTTMSDHSPQKRPDFSKPKEERDAKPKGCGGCGCSSVTTTVAPVKS